MVKRARPGFDPATSRTLSANHTLDQRALVLALLLVLPGLPLVLGVSGFVSQGLKAEEMKHRRIVG